MKKRVLALVMSTAMIASVLTACGGAKTEAPAADTATETKTEAAPADAAEAGTEAAAENVD